MKTAGFFIIGLVLLAGLGAASEWWRPIAATPLIPVIDPLVTSNVNPSNGLLVLGGGVLINSTIARPACSAATRGTAWFNVANLGVADGVSFCVKTALDTYLWKDINLV